MNKALFEAATFGVEQAVASVRDAKQALSRTTIVAPMSGKVTRLNVEEGETAIMGTLNKDAATLLTISDMSVLETKVKVDETDVARISVGDSALIQIDAFPDTTFVGRVVEISNSSVTKSTAATTGDQAIDYEVRVQLVNPPEETRPDFSATAKIVTAQPHQGAVHPDHRPHGAGERAAAECRHRGDRGSRASRPRKWASATSKGSSWWGRTTK